MTGRVRMSDKLRSEQGEHARGVWTKLGKMEFEREWSPPASGTDGQPEHGEGRTQRG